MTATPEYNAAILIAGCAQVRKATTGTPNSKAFRRCAGRSIGAAICTILMWSTSLACSSSKAGTVNGPCYGNGTCNSGLVCFSQLCVGPGDGGTNSVTINPLVISAATRTERITTLSINYWQWMPGYAYGDEIAGTDALVAALKPALMRVGGYDNDVNTPNPLDNAAFDKAVAYARAIGAEPLIQVPLLADNNGQPPTPDTAAAMVAYANITMGYGIKYFSVGNEPDLYGDQGSVANRELPAIPGYTPTDYCTSARADVVAMKAVDPTIMIVGPDLAYKYQSGSSSNDWLTPILNDCGDLFDIVSIHRYPFEALQAKLVAAAADPAAFRGVITSVFGILQATGQGAKPLALTEMNVAYDATTCVLDASPGTVGSALWMADSVGMAIELGLWTTAVWDISDAADWDLGLIGVPPAHTPQPSYYAYAFYADHFGPTLVKVTTAPPGVSGTDLCKARRGDLIGRGGSWGAG